MTETDTASLSVRDKSFPADAAGLAVDAFLATEPALADFSTPLFALAAEPLAHNIATIARWAVQQGAELMPHGKTTMAPSLWRRQLDAGATGITVATGWQARVALHEGVETVQIANECLDPGSLRAISAHLSENPRAQVLAWADSVSTISLMEEVLGEVAESSRIGILVEWGAAGARTGARSAAVAREVVAAVRASGSLRLAGVAGYEGALAHDRAPSSLQAVGAYLADLAAFAIEVAAEEPSAQLIVSAGGSAYLDLVAEHLASCRQEGLRVVVRSGASLTHDDGFYEGISPLSAANHSGQDLPLRSAMVGFARIVSMPEPGLALCDAGKRDFPFDEGLPAPLAWSTALGAAEHPLHGARVTALNDQHLFLRLAPDAEGPTLGDVVRFGLSHPCTAFDKWRRIPEFRADGTIVAVHDTRF